MRRQDLKRYLTKILTKTKSMAATKTILETCDRALRRGQFCTLFLLLTISLLFVIDIEYLGEYGLNRHKTTITKNKLNIEILEK